MKTRFGIEDVCIVADRGMMKVDTLKTLDERGIYYILGTRMRSQNEVRHEVLSRAGRYKKVHREPSKGKTPSPLEVKSRKCGSKVVAMSCVITRKRKNGNGLIAARSSMNWKPNSLL